MDEDKKPLIPDASDCESQIPGTYPGDGTSTSTLIRRRPIILVTLVRILVLCFVLNSILISTSFGDRIWGFLSPMIPNRGSSSHYPHTEGYLRWPPTWPVPPSACPFPLPNLLTHKPVSSGNIPPRIQSALDSLHRYLLLRTSAKDIDSLAIAVVTPAGPIFERGYGVLKANDTSRKQYRVDKDSIYRIASVSKMFTVFETLLLRERGILEFDDPVEKYIPEFKPPTKGWVEYLRDRKHSDEDEDLVDSKSSRTTLRQLASHTGGVGRDYPVIKLEGWPFSKEQLPNVPVPSHNATFEAVLNETNKYPLVNTPYSYPVYSNVGFDLLGLANVAANLKAKADLAKDEPQTHKELLKRDIFDAFGLNSSFFRVPEEQELKDHIAIPSKDSEWADAVLGDTVDSAGGQYSSLSDLAKMAQIFLSAKAFSKEFKFLPALMREWLRPMHLWHGGDQAVGAPWEISYLPPGAPAMPGTGCHSHHGCFDDDYPGHFPHDFALDELPVPPGTPGRYYPPFPGNVPIYSKSGNMPGYHSIFSLTPEYGYGVIVLVTGTYSQTQTFAYEALRRLQPAFGQTLAHAVDQAYVGTWEPVGDAKGKRASNDTAEVRILNGQLFLTKLVAGGVDVLDTLKATTGATEERPDKRPQRRCGCDPTNTCDSWPPQPVALWSTGRLDEFRMAVGRGWSSSAAMFSCMSYWASIDIGAFARGASVDLVYWEDGELVYPSAGARFKKKTCRSRMA